MEMHEDAAGLAPSMPEMYEDAAEVLAVFFEPVVEGFYVRLVEEPQHLFLQLPAAFARDDLDQFDAFSDRLLDDPVQFRVEFATLIDDIVEIKLQFCHCLIRVDSEGERV